MPPKDVSLSFNLIRRRLVFRGAWPVFSWILIKFSMPFKRTATEYFSEHMGRPAVSSETVGSRRRKFFRRPLRQIPETPEIPEMP